jgi:hypothetical protein
MSSFKNLKDHIDLYIQDRVDDSLNEALTKMIEDRLVPLAKAYMQEHLVKLLNRLIEEALEDSLEQLMTNFSVPEILTSTSPTAVKPYVFQDISSSESDKVTAFLQHYQKAYGEDTKPPRSLIQKHLSIGDTQLSKIMQALQESGKISVTVRDLKILKPLENPSLYMNDPFGNNV